MSVAIESTPLPASIGPYLIREVIAEGGMGVVYLAEHTATHARAAVKTARLPQEGILSGLRREIHALARLRHPGVVPVLDQGFHDGIPWYAMPLLEGRTLAGLFTDVWKNAPWNADADAATLLAPATEEEDEPRPTSSTSDGTTARASSLLASSLALPAPPFHVPPLPPLLGRRPAAGGQLLAVLRVLREICVTLAFLHGEGVVHCDLKPDNIALDAQGAPVLLDFGLASRSPGALGREVLDVTAVQGTAAYMAPEQIGGELVDARADLYAVGCLLYEAVTGSPPFTGGSVQSVLLQHLSAALRPPSSLVSGVPPALDELILRLLEKRPRKRPGHADDIACALEALGAAPLRKGVGAPRPYVYRPELAGRKAALAELTLRVERTRARSGGAVLMRGESGIGKTYLAMSLAREAADRGLMVITGACVAFGAFEQGDGPPSRTRPRMANTGDAHLRPFRPFLQAVADRCRAHGPAMADALLADRGPLLAAFAPELRELPGQDVLPEPPELPVKHAHQRLLRALADTVRAFARTWPLLLVLDDLQWADELSLELLALLVTERLDAQPLLLLGTYRAEETTPELRALDACPGVHGTVLGRLDEPSVRAMVADMLALDEPPAHLVAFLARQSGGNPFYVAEYLRSAVTEGLLRRSPEGRWEFAVFASAYERLPLPRSLRALLDHVLAKLPAGARDLALAASVLGREVEADLLLQVARLGEAESLDALRELLVRQILEEAGPGRLRFLHDKLREVAYAAIPPAEERALHLRAGLALEASSAASVELPHLYGRLAHHFTRAGETPKALGYLEKAAVDALRSFADREAIGFLRELLALRLTSLLGPGGEAKGRDPTAIAALVLGGQIEPRARLDLARCQRQLADAYSRLGDVAATSQHGSRALAWAGRLPPRDARGWALLLPREIAIQAVHRLLPALARAERAESEQELGRERSLALGEIAEGAYFEGAFLPHLAAMVGSVNEAETAGGDVDVTRPYSAIGLACATFRLPNLARKYFALGRASAERRGDAAMLAFSAWIESVSLRRQSRWEEARAASAEGERHAAQAGQRQTLERLWINQSLVERWSGDLEASIADAERAMRSARERGDRSHLGGGFSVAVLGLIDLGRLDDAEALIERERDVLEIEATGDTQLLYLGMRALFDFRRGRLGEAVRAVERLDAAVNQRAAPTSLGAVLSIMLDIHLAHQEAAGSAQPEEAARAGRAARASLRALFRAGLAEPAYMIRYCRQRGQADRIAGARRSARWWLKRACARARTLKMPREEASAHLELARLEPAGAARREHLDRAEALFTRMGCQLDIAACRRLRAGAT